MSAENFLGRRLAIDAKMGVVSVRRTGPSAAPARAEGNIRRVDLGSAQGSVPGFLKAVHDADHHYRRAVRLADQVRRNYARLERLVGPGNALAALNQAISFLDVAERRHAEAKRRLELFIAAQEGPITI